MGVFRRNSVKSVVKTAQFAPAPRHFTNPLTRRSVGTASLVLIATISLGQVVTDGSLAVAARTNSDHPSAPALTAASQRAAARLLAQSADRADVIRIASSLRNGALTVARADSTARARALAKERAHAKARAKARELARAKAKEVAHAKSRKAARRRSAPHKSSTRPNTSNTPLALSLAANVAPDPDFMTTCATPSNSYYCLGQEVEAIDNARGLEGLDPLTLNLAAFGQLNPAEQVFVLANLERTARGLTPAIVLTSQLDSTALRAALATNDPTLTGWTLAGGKQAVAWNSNWSGGMSATESDYYWMYSDGSGYNVGCTSSVTTGCWEHRANILAAPAESCPGATTPQFVMGAAVADTASYSPSEAEILVQVCGGLPSDSVFSWPQAEKLLGIAVG